MVQVTVQLPDEIARRFSTEPAEIPRRILEAVATEGFRSAKLSREQVGELLRLDSREAGRFLGRDEIARDPEIDRIQAQQDRNFAAFREKLPELLRTHPGQFVAITDGAIVDCDPDKWTLVKRAAAHFAGRPTLIQQAAGDGMADVHLDFRDLEFAEGRMA